MADFDMTRDHFALFDLAPAFGIDAAALEQRYRELQARVHPDKHAHLPDAEQRVAMQRATHANEAYQTLKSPLKRAQYLLSLRGVDPQVERNTAMPMEFLVEQLECREAVAEARQEHDLEALEALERDMRRELRTEYASVGAQLDAGDNEAAAQTVRRLLFKEKLLHEIGDAIEAIETA
ncbi:MAG TPA: Fe-S protein assembly co-chaperone HscB [Rhodocyclaceae bacterium]|nr:Fe-S protein assembly co-chaperone HscB [Rhodocyclaceae bacterium]